MTVDERRKREREARVKLILNSALKIFAMRDPRETTVEEIAQAAELGKGTIYYYFPSKQAILKELVESNIVNHFDGICNRINGATSPLKVTQEIIKVIADNYRKDPELFRFFCLVSANSQGEMKEAQQTFSRKHRQWLTNLEETIEKSSLTSIVATKDFIGFIGTHVHGIAHLVNSGQDMEELKNETLNTLKRLYSGLYN
jgi:AcrR family transcriptional regulator